MTPRIPRNAAQLAALMLLVSSRLYAQAIPEIKFERYTLPNGLEVILHEDHSVPLVAVNTWYKVGSGDELAGDGIRHLLTRDVHGIAERTIGEFDTCSSSGGNNNGRRARTDELVRMDASNALPLALWLDADGWGGCSDDGPAEARSPAGCT